MLEVAQTAGPSAAEPVEFGLRGAIAATRSSISQSSIGPVFHHQCRTSASTISTAISTRIKNSISPARLLLASSYSAV